MGGLAMYSVEGTPAIMSITGLGYAFTSSSRKALFLRAVLHGLLPLLSKRACQRIVFENHDDLLFFLERFGLAQEKLHVLKGIGVDTNEYRFMPERDGAPVVVLVARMLQDKGVYEFVDAAKGLKSQGVQARFVLVGDVDPPNPAAISRDQLQAWHESGTVEWWGYCENMLSVFAQAHIVCLPSYREGLSRVLIEAAACGRPIVTTNVPGCKEIVRNGQNGFLVPAKDSKALANALFVLLSDKGLRQIMGRKGRALIEQEFSLEKTIELTFDMYRKLTDW